MRSKLEEWQTTILRSRFDEEYTLKPTRLPLDLWESQYFIPFFAFGNQIRFCTNILRPYQTKEQTLSRMSTHLSFEVSRFFQPSNLQIFIVCRISDKKYWEKKKHKHKHKMKFISRDSIQCVGQFIYDLKWSSCIQTHNWLRRRESAFSQLIRMPLNWIK